MSENNSFGEPTGNIDSSFDADSAFNEAMASEGKFDVPMSANESTSEAQQSKEAVQQAIQEFKFKHKDKEISIPSNDPKVIQWLQQGYDYGANMQSFNQARTAFEQEAAQIRQINDALEKNPQLYDTIKQAIQGHSVQAKQSNAAPDLTTALEGLDSNHPLTQLLGGMMEKLESTQTYLNNWQQEKALETQKAEDSKLDQEIKGIQEKYKDLAWDQIDENGFKLEQKILRHAKQIGTNSFSAAFKDLMHDDLIKRAQESAKTSHLAEIEKNKKLGLLGKSQAPTKGISSPRNIKQTSYNDLLNEALQEISGT